MRESRLEVLGERAHQGKTSAYLSVGGQFVEKPVVESDMLEYDQTLSFFAAVLRTDVVSSLEEKSGQVTSVSQASVQKKAYDYLLELLRTEFKDRRNRELWCFVVMHHERDIECRLFLVHSWYLYNY